MTVDNYAWASESSPELSFLLVPKSLEGREISHHVNIALSPMKEKHKYVLSTLS